VTRHGKRARFYSTVDLVNALEQEKAAGRVGRIAHSLMNMDLVILDELGYLPFSPSGVRFSSTCYRSSTSAPASSSPPT